EQSPVGAPGHVHDLGGVQVVDEGLGDEALVEDLPGRVDLLVTAPDGGLGLGEDALVGGRQLRVAEPGPGRRDLPAGQIQLGGAGPVVAEYARDAGDGATDGRDDGIAAPGVVDRVAHHVAQARDAVVAQQ